MIFNFRRQHKRIRQRNAAPEAEECCRCRTASVPRSQAKHTRAPDQRQNKANHRTAG